MKTRLYILTGIPYAGKTTLREKLTERFGFSYVSMDEVIDEENLDVAKMSQEDWNRVYARGYERLERLLAHGRTVVLDLGNLKRSERDAARSIVQKLNVSSKLIYVDTPADEVERRWLLNEKTGERGQLHSEGLQLALAMFEEPTKDERPIRYSADTNFEEWARGEIS